MTVVPYYIVRPNSKKIERRYQAKETNGCGRTLVVVSGHTRMWAITNCFRALQNL